MTAAAIVLAAGKSTRMKSAWPKVIHEVCGRPMIEYVLDAARGAGVSRLIVVVGHRADLVRNQLSHHTDVVFAEQLEQKGTGHAVQMCKEALAGHNGPVLILAGDTPLLRAESLQKLLHMQESAGAACVIGTAETANNHGLGRIVRTSSGEFDRIVEEKDATEVQRRIQEINTGCYTFDTSALLRVLDQLQPNNVQGEYYLTDCPRLLREQGRIVTASSCFTMTEALGVNTRLQLAEVTAAIQHATLERLMLSGVTIVSPATTMIDPQATIGTDTVIEPCVVIRGPVVIGENCRIHPHCTLTAPLQIPAGTEVPAGSVR